MKKIIVIENSYNVRYLMGKVKYFAKNNNEKIINKSLTSLTIKDSIVIFLDASTFKYENLIAKHDSPNTVYFVTDCPETAIFTSSINIIKKDGVRWQELIIEIFKLEPKTCFKANHDAVTVDILDVYTLNKTSSYILPACVDRNDIYSTYKEASTELASYAERKKVLNDSAIATLESENKKIAKYLNFHNGQM